jgi:hypothetical protein
MTWRLVKHRDNFSFTLDFNIFSQKWNIKQARAFHRHCYSLTAPSATQSSSESVREKREM